MSQKINPLSNKLGVIQVWNFNLPIYGKNFTNYTKILKLYNFIFNYIKCYCAKHNLLVESIFINYTTQQVFIRICIAHLQNSFSLQQTKKLLFTLEKWLHCPIVLTFYKKSEIGSSSLLVNNYLNNLFSQKLTSSKQILQTIYKIFKDQSKKVKIIYTSIGIKKFELKGFKIELSGCFDSSRSRMAKTVKYKFGSVSLTRLKGYIDYSSSTFFTKFGSCGLKLWLFYDFR